MLVQRLAGAPEFIADVEVVRLEVVGGDRQAEVAGGEVADGGEQPAGSDHLVVAGAVTECSCGERIRAPRTRAGERDEKIR